MSEMETGTASEEESPSVAGGVSRCALLNNDKGSIALSFEGREETGCVHNI